MLKEHKAFFIALQSGVIPYGVGEPGISKTRRTEAFARRCALAYECVIGSQRLPEDVLGSPKVIELTDRHGRLQHVTEHLTPAWRFRLQNHERGGLLHLDELGDCPPAVQAAFLQILGDGIPGVWICATGNPLEISTNGYELGLPAINRLCQIEWPADREAWGQGLLHGWETIEDFPILPVAWASELQVARSLVVEFTRKNPTHAQSVPTDQAEVSPWPSLRSWTNAATVLAAARAAGETVEVEDLLIRGCVGDGASIAFRNWVKRLDLADPEDILRDPSLFKPTLRGDLAFTTICAVVAAVLRNNTEERWLAAWEVLDRQAATAIDIAAAAAGPLAKNRPVKNGAQLEIPKGIETKLFEILSTAT